MLRTERRGHANRRADATSRTTTYNTSLYSETV
jgi:hypothetical protein